MVIATLFISLLVMIVLGFPVAFALAASALLAIIIDGQVPELVVLHRMVGGIDSFPLLSIPFFVLAGALMNSSGITARIFDFANAMVGWMRGGLGHVNISASIMFAGMS
jgi:TRAP-type mannitol/chloroaromatic compound transport system permease large subunit